MTDFDKVRALERDDGYWLNRDDLEPHINSLYARIKELEEQLQDEVSDKLELDSCIAPLREKCDELRDIRNVRNKQIEHLEASNKELEEAIDAQCCTCFHRTRCGLAKKIEHLEAENERLTQELVGRDIQVSHLLGVVDEYRKKDQGASE